MSRKVDENGYVTTTTEANPIEYAPVKHGHWRLTSLPSYRFCSWRCSVCAELVYGKTNYCPNCGVRMDEVMPLDAIVP